VAILPTREEIRSMTDLAAPIVLMQLGMMLYGVVDTLYMGRIGAGAVAGVGLGGSTFFALMLFGLGTLLGVDTLSSRAYGAGRPKESAAIFAHAVAIAVLFSVPLFLAVGFAGPFYALIGVDAEVTAIALDYLDTLRWMTLPFLVFAACRHYLQSIDVTRPLLAAILAGNLLNVALNYALIFGHWGFPRLGITGCALASVANATVMTAIAGAAAVTKARESGYAFRGLRRPMMLALIGLGIPAGLQMFVEVSMFSLVTTFMGKFGPIPTAAHQITMNLVSVTFMIPLGVSFAAAVRVGQGLGRNDPEAAVRSGRTALFLGVGVMACAAAAFWTVPGFFIRLYTDEPEVVGLATTMLFVGGLFQIFDGMQIVMNGAIRGLGETRIQLWAHLAGFGAVGLPLGLWLAFRAGFGPVGLWYGLLTGLTLAGVGLFGVWRVMSGRYLRMSSNSTSKTSVDRAGIFGGRPLDP
jgi:MATE family multidrug resistance protein